MIKLIEGNEGGSELMYTLIEWLFVDPYLAMATVITIATVAAMLYVIVQLGAFVKKWGAKSAVIQIDCDGSKEPRQIEVLVSAHKEKINRLMRVHGVTEAKAEQLQNAIYEDWNESSRQAQKSVDKQHGEILNKLK